MAANAEALSRAPQHLLVATEPAAADGPAWCAPHFERTGERRPAFRMGMCRECWSGKPLREKTPSTSRKKPMRRLSPEHRQHLREAALRSWSARRGIVQ